MGEISAASNEQSSGIDQVNTAITSMDEVTQQNAALVEEAAAAAESLVEQAATLMDTVNEFKLNGSGGATNERRATGSAMRTTNRPVAKPAPAKQVTAQVLAKTGTDGGDWEEF
jgi:methyl-accepting chemotaxis protein